jgi:hypothetical protein
MLPDLESSLSSAISSVQAPFSTKAGVSAFLSSRDLHKPNDHRLFAWLVELDLIPLSSDTWARALSSRCSVYRALERVPPPEEEARVIRADTSRSVLWFAEMARDFLVPAAKADAEGMANRILIAMKRNYVQGYDRYVFVCLYLALEFCAREGLPLEVGEAIAFDLSREFISLSGITRFLENPGETQAHFGRMDADLKKYAPGWMAMLNCSGQGSIHFALRWELLLFADEYPVRELLLIWDNALRWRERYADFLYALCIAHVKCAALPKPECHEIPIVVIQTYKGWDVPQVLDEAVEIMGVARKRSKWALVTMANKKYMYVWIIVAACLLVWFLRKFLK